MINGKLFGWVNDTNDSWNIFSTTRSKIIVSKYIWKFCKCDNAQLLFIPPKKLEMTTIPWVRHWFCWVLLLKEIFFHWLPSLVLPQSEPRSHSVHSTHSHSSSRTVVGAIDKIQIIINSVLQTLIKPLYMLSISLTVSF